MASAFQYERWGRGYRIWYGYAPYQATPTKERMEIDVTGIASLIALLEEIWDKELAPTDCPTDAQRLYGVLSERILRLEKEIEQIRAEHFGGTFFGNYTADC